MNCNPSVMFLFIGVKLICQQHYYEKITFQRIDPISFFEKETLLTLIYGNEFVLKLFITPHLYIFIYEEKSGKKK